MCIHMLLILDADFSIANDNGETADDLCTSLYDTTAKNLRFEAMRFLLNRLHPHQFSELPHNPVFTGVLEEAKQLLKQGRVVYSDPPKSFTDDCEILRDHFAVLRRQHLSFNKPLADVLNAGDNSNTATDAAAPGPWGSSNEMAEEVKAAAIVARAGAGVGASIETGAGAGDERASTVTIQTNWVTLYDEYENAYYYNEVWFLFLSHIPLPV